MFIDIKNEKRTYMCAQFNDGLLTVNNTWIKQKLMENTYIVYYPRKSSSSNVVKNIDLSTISNWPCGEAIITCSHDSYSDACQHLKDLSESDDDYGNKNAVAFESSHDLENAALETLEFEMSSEAIEIVENVEIPVTDVVITEDPLVLHEIVDNISDISGVKAVLKDIIKKLDELELNISKPNKIVNTTRQINMESLKIASIDEFIKFTEKISASKEYREKLVQKWQNLPKGLKQQKYSGKVHSILCDIFDLRFLKSQVMWGYQCNKSDEQPGKDEGSSQEATSMISLKKEDVLLNMIIKSIGLTQDSQSYQTLKIIMQNLFRNKLKRSKESTTQKGISKKQALEIKENK